MYAHRFLLMLSFFMVSGLLGLLSQTTVGSAGGDTSGPGGTVGFTVGQVAYTNFDGESGSINQGVHQPYDIIMVSTAEPEIGLKATIFPNPTATSIQLILDELVYYSGTDLFTYVLYDSQGRMIQQHRITAPITVISLDKLFGVVYFLRVSNNDSEVKTFKIFKTN